jgi:thioredoxin 1
MAIETTEYTILTNENFSDLVLQSNKPVLVDFWAPWCGPCRTMNPIISELSAEFDGQVTIGKVNVDQQPQLAAEYRIQSIPSFLLFRDGIVIDTLVGAVPKKVLVEKIQTIANMQ